jgi:hypothetical protein
MDHRPRQRHVEGTLSRAQDADLDLRAGRTAQLVDGFFEAHPLGRMAVDAQDDVAGLEAGAGRRGILDRRDDLRVVLVARKLGADPGELAMAVGKHLAVFVLVHIVRMRIEPVEHPLEARLDEFLLVDRLDVASLDALDHLTIEREVGVAGAALHGRAAAGEQAESEDPGRGGGA